MSLFDRLRRATARALLAPDLRVSPEDPRIALSDPRIVELVFGGGARTKAGVAVNEAGSLNVATVYACVRVLSETVASLPLQVYQAVEQDGRARRVLATRHGAYPLLHDAPNDLMSSFTWRELAMAHCLLWGNHYSQLQWANSGRLLAIWPMLPWAVTPRWADGGRRKVYDVRTSSGLVELPDDEVLHVPALSFDGLAGISPIQKLRESLGVAIASRDFSSSFFANGLRPGAILETPGALSAEAQANLAKSVAAEMAGVENKFKVMVLEQGAKLHQVQMSPQDAQFIELGLLTARQVAGAFRVPPYMIGDLEQANYNNIEQQDLGFAKHTIVPWLVRWEQELNRKLFVRGSGYYAKFALQGLLRGDFKTRTEGYGKGITDGWLTRNEARELEEFDSIDGLDTPLMPLNMTDGTQAPAGAKPKEPAQ